MNILFGKTIDMLSEILDFRSERNKVIASNIANIDTPGYKTKELSFKKQLENFAGDNIRIRMAKTNRKHLSESSKDEFDVINSEEPVRLDNEMEKLAENTLMYNLSIELMAKKFKELDSVLREAK
ncbi:MAG: flagellar basal body rod protein FlgB [Nitrospiraceae bacterium]|nr:flagellar basal body rod protein FlgB [Nitrospiraceae bacterium]